MPQPGTIRTSSGAVIDTDGTNSVVALPYSASITPNADYGDYFMIVVADTNGFAINAPTNPATGRVITFEILNSSGATMGIISWNAIFKKSWSNPGNGLRSTIQFIYNGTNWVQIGAQSAAI